MYGHRRYLFFALIALSICALAFYVQRHKDGKTGWVDNQIIAVTGFFQKQTHYVVNGFKVLVDDYFLLVNTKRKNRELRREVAFLSAKVASLEEVKSENVRLRSALDFKKNTDHKLISSHVVSHDISSDYFGVRIDKGAEEGVKIGYGVVSPHGVVGRVQRVTPHYSYVRTVLDPASNIDAIVQRTRARGIITGDADYEECLLKYIDHLDDVAVNDTVVSSGFESIFPKGMLVGFVVSVEPEESGLLKKVVLKTAVDFFRLEEVFVVQQKDHKLSR